MKRLLLALLLSSNLLQSGYSTAADCMRSFDQIGKNLPESLAQSILKKKVLTNREVADFVNYFLPPQERTEFNRIVKKLPKKIQTQVVPIKNEEELVATALNFIETVHLNQFNQIRREFHWVPKFDRKEDLLSFEDFVIQYQMIRHDLMTGFSREIKKPVTDPKQSSSTLRRKMTFIVNGVLSYDLALFKNLRLKPVTFQAFSKNEKSAIQISNDLRETLTVTSRYFTVMTALYAAYLVPDVTEGIKYYRELVQLAESSPLLSQSTEEIRARLAELLLALGSSVKTEEEKEYLRDLDKMIHSAK